MNWDVNQHPPKYKTRVLLTQQQESFFETCHLIDHTSIETSSNQKKFQDDCLLGCNAMYIV